MRILVTGGAGFIGSNLVHELLGKDASQPVERVVNLDALTYCGNRDNLAGLEGNSRHVFVHGSIGDEALVASLLREHQIESVMNLAAESHVDRSIDSPAPFIETNVAGTFRLLESCRQYVSTLAEKSRQSFRFLHVSTDEVFGSLKQSELPFSEATAYAPRSPYSASKAAGDHLVRAYGHTYGLPVLVTHCSNNYGPRQFPEKLIPLMILNALDGLPLPVYGDGSQRRDWIHVSDHCLALQLVLQRGHAGETYCIGGNSEMANLEIIRMLCEILDQRAPRPDGQDYSSAIEHVIDRPGHDCRYAISTEKICHGLGWKPQESLRSGLEKTVGWYLENRAWCEEITRRGYSRQRLGLGPA